MKTKYEYDIVEKATGRLISYANSRSEARIEKDICNQCGSDVKIIQRKYVLTEEKVVR